MQVDFRTNKLSIGNKL